MKLLFWLACALVVLVGVQGTWNSFRSVANLWRAKKSSGSSDGSGKKQGTFGLMGSIIDKWRNKGSGSSSGSHSGGPGSPSDGHGSHSGSKGGHGSHSSSSNGHGSHSGSKGGHGSHSSSPGGHGSHSSSPGGHGSHSSSPGGHGSHSSSPGGHGGPTRLSVRPKCCNLCRLIVNPHSDYHRNCGRYLEDSVQMAIKKDCWAITGGNIKAKMHQMRDRLRNKCYSKFGVLVEFDCLPVEVKQSGGNCHERDVEDICKDQDTYCPPEPECRDHCRSLIMDTSQFYRVCGSQVDQRIRDMWYWRCNSACDPEGKAAVFAQIRGYCHCNSPDDPPNFCEY